MQGSESNVGCDSPAQESEFPMAGERRRDPRYRPLTASVYIGWWEGEAFRTELTVIRDISVRGAAVNVRALPDCVATVWVCLVGPGRVTWVPTRRVAIEDQVARLEFAEPCGDDMIAPLIWGLT